MDGNGGGDPEKLKAFNVRIIFQKQYTQLEIFD